jgi:hypothetical protein
MRTAIGLLVVHFRGAQATRVLELLDGIQGISATEVVLDFSGASFAGRRPAANRRRDVRHVTNSQREVSGNNLCP